MKKFLFFLFALIVLSSFTSDKPSYQLFSPFGEVTSYEELKKTAAEADVVLFGELHNNPVCHWLQLELSKDLFAAKNGNIVMGAEMFESDNQLMLDELIAGLIRLKDFESQARLWPNYSTDYKPLIEFAHSNKLPFIATNVPRRYAALVNKKGFEGLNALSPEAKTLFPPLPIPFDPELACYKAMASMGMHSGNLAKAQALKDATMAHFILENLKGGQTFIHFHGTYHSDNYESIVWYLKKRNPDLKILTISSVEQSQLKTLEESHKQKGDFILAVSGSMTKTY